MGVEFQHICIFMTFGRKSLASDACVEARGATDQ